MKHIQADVGEEMMDRWDTARKWDQTHLAPFWQWGEGDDRMVTSINAASDFYNHVMDDSLLYFQAFSDLRLLKEIEDAYP